MRIIREESESIWSALGTGPVERAIGVAYYTMLAVFASIGVLLFAGVSAQLISQAWRFFTSSLA